MSGRPGEVRVEDLVAVPDRVAGGGERWSVWRGEDLVGRLEQRRADGLIWLSGTVRGDRLGSCTVEGPTALSVLRRAACALARNDGFPPRLPADLR